MTEDRAIAYLLEELPEEEIERFEDECFSEDTWPEEIEQAEHDLIDAYLRNELESERRQRFEQNYLTTTARQERVSMAAALLRLVDERNAAAESAASAPAARAPGSVAERLRGFFSSKPWRLRAAAAFATLIILAGVTWLLFLRAPSPRTYAAVTLTIGRASRGDGGQAASVTLPAGAAGLKVSLTLPQDLPSGTRSYRLELENLENAEITPVEVSGNDGAHVFAAIPSTRLEPGRYTIRLSVILADGSEQSVSDKYFFIVETKK